MRAPTLALVGALAGAAPVGAQDAAAVVVTIRTTPDVPLRGSVAWLDVVPGPEGAALDGVEGDAADEPLHFLAAEGRYRALVGVPLEGTDTLELRLRLRRGERTDTTRVALAVSQPTLRSERLRVPPAMASPDSARRERIERELAEAREVSRRAHDTPRLWEAFQVPRPARITSVYGTAREFNGEVTSRHMGVDFAGAVGAPVHAAGRAVVALVADFYLAGRAIYLDHGAGLVTGYFHLSRIDVAQGDTVAAGERIGAVGRSGRVTGPHLHWVARYGAISVDPLSLVRLTSAEVSRQP